jgi:hypothetical protein
MKILFISMPSIHVIRWIENLKETSYDLYWFDVLERGKLDTFDSVHQFTDWKKRKVAPIRGECFLSKKVPSIYEKIIPYLEITANEALEKIIKKIQPDIIHSFEMQSCSYPILKTMNKFSSLKWIYSCWGSDLYYYQNFSSHQKKIKKVLQRINFLHTDCDRDFRLAQELGFSGKHVGIIPGGTGYKIEELEQYKWRTVERKIILVKGYEHQFGRGLNLVKALHLIKDNLADFEIVVFGAHSKVIDYVKDNHLGFRCFTRHGLTHDELIKLMGKSLLYIGNSISDGIPNTLLEAVLMGAFPIQSNPGGVTEEIIKNNENGFLIHDAENVEEIKLLFLKSFEDFELRSSAFNINSALALEKLGYEVNKNKVVFIYESIS